MMVPVSRVWPDIRPTQASEDEFRAATWQVQLVGYSHLDQSESDLFQTGKRAGGCSGEHRDRREGTWKKDMSQTQMRGRDRSFAPRRLLCTV
jgi:hypothetical protein